MAKNSISNVLSEYLSQDNIDTCTICSVRDYYLNQVPGADKNRVRNAIYLKALRMTTQGLLEKVGKQGKETLYRTTDKFKKTAHPVPTKKQEQDSQSPLLSEQEQTFLNNRLVELEYEFDLNIAEAKGFDELQSTLPSIRNLIIEKKQEAKQQAIVINGKINSIRKLMLSLNLVS